MLRFKVTEPFLRIAINGYLKILTKLSKKDSQFYIIFFMISFICTRLLSTFLTFLHDGSFLQTGFNLGFDALWIFLMVVDWNNAKPSFEKVKACYQPNTIVSMPNAFPHRSDRFRSHALMILIFAATMLIALFYVIFDLAITKYFESFLNFLAFLSAFSYCMQASFMFFYAQSNKPTIFAKAKEKAKNLLENRQRTPVLLPTGV